MVVTQARQLGIPLAGLFDERVAEERSTPIARFSIEFRRCGVSSIISCSLS